MSRTARAAALVVLATFAFASPASAATLTVTTTGDAGPGSLRDAITQANATAGADTIQFGISGTAVHTITLGSNLPEITHPVTIDGYSQTGATANSDSSGSNAVLTIVIDAESHDGLVISGGGSTIKGLVIHDAASDGITLKSTGGNTIAGNFIGTDASGANPGTNADFVANRNRSSGIRILSGDDNVIGGTTPAARNVISANGDFVGSEGEAGVAVNGGSGAVIEGNRIGTDPTGTQAVENGTTGVWVDGFNPGGTIADTTVGGTAAGAGNLISGNKGGGVQFVGAGNGKVLGNRIGTNAAGSAAIPNTSEAAVEADDDAVTIGDDQGHGNLISGNAGYGIEVFGTGHEIEGNKIGTNAAGTAALPNGNAGIQIAASDVTVGGTTAGAGNLISGNHTAGIGGDGPAGATIEGNLIGTDATGNVALGNGGGIALAGGTSNTIGGTAAGAGNVISANDGPGVSLTISEGALNDDNVVTGNAIGTNAAGTAALGNTGAGVRIVDGHRSVIGTTADGNVIANNGDDGVLVTGNGGSIDNSVRGNSIASNAGLGIDLGETTTDASDDGDGVTPNDAGDADSGNNGLQNFPLVSAALPGGGTTISGTLNSKPSTTYAIDLYDNANCDASGNGEAGTYLGSVTATTNATGNASWSKTVATTVATGRSVTATATDPTGSTSELSPCRHAGPPADLSLTLGTSAARPAAGSNVTLTTTVKNDGPAAATGVSVAAKLPAGFTFVSANPAAAYNSATGVWTIGSLAAGGATAQLQVVARVDDGSPVDVTSQVRTSDQGDLDSIPGNDVAGEDDQATVRIAGAGIFVNDTGSAVNGADGHCTLREAIVAANTDTASGAGAGECSAGSGADDVTLQTAASYTFADASGGTANALPAVTSTIRIVGRDSNILRSLAAGTPAFRFVQVSASGDLTVDAVRFIDGQVAGSNCGGAIYNQGSLTLEGGALLGNSVAVPGGTAIGGAICNEGALAIHGSELDNNVAQGDNGFGGAISSSTPAGEPQATATVDGTTMLSNETVGTVVSQGGAIRSVDARLTVSGSSGLGGNTAQTGTGAGLGGGIAALGGTLSVADTTFNSNEVAGSGAETRRHGGAIGLDQGVDATLTNATVGTPPFPNKAVGAGAGISVEGAATKLAVDGGSVSNNVSSASFNTDGGGAGIANGDGTGAPGTVTLDGVTIKGNSCPLCDGGGIFNRGQLTVDGGEISSNSSLSGAGVANGSGVFTGGTLTIVGTTLTANTAAQAGGGIYVPTGTASVTGATVKDGKALYGGGLRVDPGATLTIDASTISGNTGTYGGGVAAFGTATITATTISGNHAEDGVSGLGGGVFDHDATLSIARSAILGNNAHSLGGGVHNQYGGIVAIDDTTISGNSAPGGGGGLANIVTGSTMAVRSSTIAENTTDNDGGGVYNDYGGSQSFANTIIAGNVSKSGIPADCLGTGDSNGHNLLGDSHNDGGQGCPHDGPGDEIIDSRLGLTEEMLPLADNGGPTKTYALRPGSIAIDAGSPAAPGTDAVAGCSTSDQRGLARARDGDGDGDATCDIGAVEQQDPLVAPFGLHKIAPVTLAKNAPGATLTLRGGGFDAGAVVQVDGAPRPTTLVSSRELTAQLPASDLAITGDLKSYVITVVQGGAVTRPQALTVASSRVAHVNTTVVTPGGTGNAYGVPPIPGVLAKVTNNDAGGGPITVSAATYNTNPIAGGGKIFDSGGFVDLQVAGVSPGDLIFANFYYPSSITGATEAALTLRYWNGSVWAPVVASKDTTDNRDGTVSGGVFTAVFDNSSKPKLSDLNGTVFAWSDGTESPPATQPEPPDVTPPEATIAYDAARQDVAVKGIGASTNGAVKPASSTKPKRGHVKRTYALQDKAGNKLSVVLDVKRTKTTIAARLLSLRYRGGKVVKAGANALTYRWTLKRRKVQTLAQTLSVGTGKKRRKVSAKFDRRTNRTTITDPKQHKRPVKKKGLVAIRLVTAAGKFAIQY